jgi:subtilisin family serine protease
MKKLLFSLLLMGLAGAASAQQADDNAFAPVYKFRVSLTDKKNNPYSLKRPEEFLSPKSIERRRRQGLKLDRTDLPVTPAYVQEIAASGVRILSTSKWNNTVLVSTSDTSVMATLRTKPFVKATRLVARYTREDREAVPMSERLPQVQKAIDAENAAAAQQDGGAEQPEAEKESPGSERDMLVSMLLASAQSPSDAYKDSVNIAASVLLKSPLFRLSSRARGQQAGESAEPQDPVYGQAAVQARQLRIDALHEQGFRGKGMTIAVIDGGFLNTDIIPMMQHINVLGTRDFAKNNGSTVYDLGGHGTMVLSCIGMNKPGQFVGTAPEASFWLINSEDGASEQLVEEDNWAAAVEFADSVGADLINTSLGYAEFDNKADNVRYSEMDGHTHIASISGSMLASKGIVLCNSAGNSANEPWKLITVPADADDVLTVGAVDSDGMNTNFSSLGNSADGRVKPDVMALGGNSTVMNVDGTITRANGTSFASPIMCGAVACFWQANPKLTALEVVQAVRRLGNNFATPNNVFGYGIPDFSK